MSALPRSVNYDDSFPSVPADARSQDIVLPAVNGSSFSSGQTAIFDFLSTGFIDPTSIYLRYTYTLVSAGESSMIGCPAYAPISRLTTLVNSQLIESQTNFNQTATMLTNLTLDVAQKYGLQNAYAYGTTATPDLSQLDGRTCVANETNSVAVPLPCVLSGCEKMIPAFNMGNIRMELTIENIASIFRPDSTALPTGFTISNMELCYKQISLGSAVEEMVRSLPAVSIRSQSFLNQASVLGAGTAGQVSQIFNMRVASIKSAFLAFANGTADSNLWADSVDITKSNGSYQINIGSVNYPQNPLSTSRNKNGALQALRGATGNIYSRDNNFSINAVEFNLEDGDATTLTEPAKYFFGVDLEKVDSQFLMSGTSSQASPITANIQLGTSTNDSHNIHMILNYDCVLETTADGQTALRM